MNKLRTILFGLSFFALSGCQSLQRQGDERDLQHVVLFWLKDSGNAEHRAQIISTSESFRAIPAVKRVEVGEVISSERPVVEDSYDVGLVVVVKNQEELQAYLDHPIHVAARDELLLPLVKKVLVYDFE